MMLATGVAASFYKDNYYIDPTCGGGVIDSNHFTFNWMGNYLEIANRRVPGGQLVVFSELVLNSSIQYPQSATWGDGQQHPRICQNQVLDWGTYAFLIRSETGAYWNIFLDCGDGAGWRSIEGLPYLNFSNGVPRSEFESFSPDNTNYGLHTTLDYRDLNFVWQTWPGILCNGADRRYAATPYVLSANSYTVVAYDDGIQCLGP